MKSNHWGLNYHTSPPLTSHHSSFSSLLFAERKKHWCIYLLWIQSSGQKCDPFDRNVNTIPEVKRSNDSAQQNTKILVTWTNKQINKKINKLRLCLCLTFLGHTSRRSLLSPWRENQYFDGVVRTVCPCWQRQKTTQQEVETWDTWAFSVSLYLSNTENNVLEGSSNKAIRNIWTIFCVTFLSCFWSCWFLWFGQHCFPSMKHQFISH